ncbi:MAG: hypothetical protein HRF43_09750 [Phycisphaerae bacterium]|jgi:hypothetical protein
MKIPKDQAALDCYREVLLNFGRVAGYIQWRQLPWSWLSTNLPGITQRLIHELMIEYVAAGGEIDQVAETRPEYVAWRFHYDLRLPISGRRVYIETVLDQADGPEDSTIWIVNMHDR